MVTRSDDWDFPTNKFPNIGWLGRVHRGTPWQTIDMKSPVANYGDLEEMVWQRLFRAECRPIQHQRRAV